MNNLIKTLLEHYPEPKCELDFINPFQLLISTVLAARTTDKIVNATAPLLFEKWGYPSALAFANPEEVETTINSISFYRQKTKSIIGLSKKLVEEFNGRVPKTMDELLTLPGVGRKTANVILGLGFGIPGVIVDGHVQRVASRLGLSDSNKPHKTEEQLTKIIPKDKWVDASLALVLHGRYVCKAKKPNCEECVFKDQCKGI